MDMIDSETTGVDLVVLPGIWIQKINSPVKQNIFGNGMPKINWYGYKTLPLLAVMKVECLI